MFERLIESEPEAADFKNRRRYFLASSLVVGVLFAAAVVVSIYAAKFDLGNGSLDLVEMVAPHDLTPVEPETRQPKPLQQTSQTQSDLPIRFANIASVNEPTIVPMSVSTQPNSAMARPEIGRFLIGKLDVDPAAPGGSGRHAPASSSSNPLGSLASNIPSEEVEKETAPPPAVRTPAIKKSGGVLNGQAISLPTPVYSATAKLAGAQGKVNVQVLIDENGNVISAHAIDGHPLLRGSAEQAARRAKFTPTFLTKVPVKVTGVISYNFTR